MHRQSKVRLATTSVALLMVGILTVRPVHGDEDSSTPPVLVGVARSFFRDVPHPLVAGIIQPFSTLLRAQTGVPGKLVVGGDALTVARELAEDKLQLAVFYGIEYAWAKSKYPSLRPLMIAVNQQRNLRAYLMVRSDCPCECFAGLKGKCLALPKGTREHCRVFMQRRCCKECGDEPERLFAKITVPANFEDALDDLVDGDVNGAVVDGIALECFKRRKPGRASRLKVAIESEVFPAGVLAYRPGYLSDDTLRRFHDGMVNADKTAIGRQLMMLWRLTGFEDVPTDYDAIVDNIVKCYPPPTAEAK